MVIDNITVINTTVNITGIIPMVTLHSITLWFIVVTFISLAGAATGFLLVTALFHQHNFKEGANPLIIHLLLVDSFNLALPTIIANAVIYTSQAQLPFSINCVPLFFIQYTGIALSHWNSVFLAINRLIAITLPHYYRGASHPAVLTGMIAFTWAISLVSTAPHLWDYAASYRLIPPIGYCGTLPNNLPVYAILNGMSSGGGAGAT
ncbi:uncharacterized protein LOC129582476 [Paramacrobiotus metropolitanus]|uniref:uncharacterized protein LOC129582476 n=1 Tax=Paramacrobiotus metropolitanus TaxID=2943436 RepID=UPI002445E3CD|nr:uncharacterized protein LOC129582476 [Paramacrobiotus metropolitanus]